MRVPLSFRWGFEDPNIDLWHFLIDTWGFPDWIRAYTLSNSTSVPEEWASNIHTLAEEQIRSVLGVHFITIAVAHGGAADLKKVYGYLPIDLHRYDITGEKGGRPGDWVTTVRPPPWLLV